jgi:hypothetical protein
MPHARCELLFQNVRLKQRSSLCIFDALIYLFPIARMVHAASLETTTRTVLGFLRAFIPTTSKWRFPSCLVVADH